MKRLISLMMVILLACGAASGALAGATLKRPVYDCGRTTVSWDVTGDDPGSFKVTVQAVNGSAFQAIRDAGTTRSHSLTTTECIPGKSYEFTLK